MKKIVTILMVVLLVFGAVACKPAAAPVAAEPATEAATEAPATDVAATEAPAAEAKVYSVVSLVNGNLGDKSFFDSAESGLKALQDAGRITYKTIEMGGTDEDQPKWLETLYEVASSGEYDLVIVGTYQMPDYLKEVATAYPDQKFLIYDDTSYVGENANVVNISYKQNDMGYLIGVFAAAMTTDTSVKNINADKVVGFVGGVDSPVINDFLYGFLEGVKATDPEVKVDTRYVNTSVLRVRGLDLTAAYAFAWNEDRFVAGLNATYLMDYQQQLTPTAPTYQRVDLAGLPVDWRARAWLSWTRGEFGATGAVNYVDNSRSHQGKRIDAWATADLQVTWSPSRWDGLTLAVSAQNLLDTDPPFYETENGTVGYDPANAEPLGRYLAVQLTKRW